jgi:hypothetical protein
MAWGCLSVVPILKASDDYLKLDLGYVHGMAINISRMSMTVSVSVSVSDCETKKENNYRFHARSCFIIHIVHMHYKIF